MSIIVADRVKETSATTGLGAYSLAGAVTGFQSFAIVGNAQQCWYHATDGIDWEVGTGTYTAAGTTLSRDVIHSSSNSNNAVNWVAGTKTIALTLPATKFGGDWEQGVTPPTSPFVGDRWLDLVNNIEFTRLNDGVNEVWAELGPEDIPDMADLFKILSADDTGQNIGTVQPWFPTAGAITVLPLTTYFMRGFLYLTRAAGATSHTTSIGIGGTATLTSMLGWIMSNTGDVASVVAATITLLPSATAVVAKAASTSTTEVAYFKLWGIIRVNAVGTIIPQFTYSAIPGGVPTVKANSFFSLVPLGTNTVTTQGSWA